MFHTKKKHLPKECPKCGTKYRSGNGIETMFDLLDYAFGPNSFKYRRFERDEPWKGYYYWDYWCGKCAWDNAINNPSIFDKIVKDDTFRGGALPVPLTTGKE